MHKFHANTLYRYEGKDLHHKLPSCFDSLLLNFLPSITWKQSPEIAANDVFGVSSETAWEFADRGNAYLTYSTNTL